MTDRAAQEAVLTMKSAFARRRALMLEGLAEVPGVETVAPDGLLRLQRILSLRRRPLPR